MTGDRAVASVWGDIFHHPDDEVVLDDTLACVRWMYSEWDGLSGWAGSRKKRPGIWLWNGMQFPVEGLGGKCVPEFAIGVGWSLPTEPQAETAFHSEGRFWDTVSGCKKGHMTWPSTYICCGYPPHDKPRSNNRASVRAAEHKVHREFRTSRRALNVLSVRAGLSERGTLRSAPPGQTNQLRRVAT